MLVQMVGTIAAAADGCCSCNTPPGTRAGNAEAAPAVSMTVETVDRALEEVRPYLIAAGGSVTVLDVVDGTVVLQLDVSGCST